jgi:pimeloyl-ACP methyl ester carboxylesterase
MFLRVWFRRIFVSLVALYLTGTILGGISLGWMATHPGRRSISAEEQSQAVSYAASNHSDFRDVTMPAEDGAILRAWFLQPAEWNGNSVLLLHGVSDNRLGMYGYGQWLLSNHYSVLLPDARAHGISGGKLASYGLNEASDIHLWVNWIERNAHPQCVFGFGESMGAGQVLQSLSTESRFCAVIAESPFETFREVSYARFGRPFHTGPWLGRTFFWPTDEVGFLFVRIVYGLNMDAVSPRDAVRKATVPVFLIHGTADRNIPPYNSEDIQRANPSEVQLWKVPGAVHCGAHEVAPDEFDRRILDWLSQHSGGTGNTKHSG